MTKIYLIRHGESLGNANGVYLGHADWDLSDKGYRQAELTAEKLLDVRFDAIYSSDLKRAYNTALPHAKLRGMNVVPCVGLREVNVGDWEELSAADKPDDEMFLGGWKRCFGTFCFPGGESIYDASLRVYKTVTELAEANEGKTLLLAMHAAVICAFWCRVKELAPESWADSVKLPTNASYSILEYSGGKFTPLEYSCDSHLK